MRLNDLSRLASRSLRSLFAVSVLGLATLSAGATTGCGRTDLEEDLLLYDGGVADGNTDVTIRDTGADVNEDVFQFDSPFEFDSPQFDSPFEFDSPIDSPFEFDSPIDSPLQETGPCGDGVCDDGETCTTCPLDCGFCPKCGDGTCNPGETCSSCPQDCGSCQTCPDGFCDNGENCLSCPADCGVCATCGDGTCSGTENCTNCPADCGTCAGCGDGHCSQDETCVSCPADCGSCAFCGNGKCDDGETCNSCPQDCGSCPIAETCEQILTCAFGCFQGGITGFQLSCLADCDANACTQAVGFANQATNCILQAFLNGTCSFGGGGAGFGCAQQACAAPIAACLGSAPCPATGSGSGTGG